MRALTACLEGTDGALGIGELRSSPDIQCHPLPSTAQLFEFAPVGEVRADKDVWPEHKLLQTLKGKKHKGIVK